MKYIVLSFDDGRKDFYTRALPILKQYSLPATLNIVTDLVGKDGIPEFASCNGACMSWEEIEESRQGGIEIAGHSADHTNEPEQIIRGSCDLAKMLQLPEPPGFASPNSGVCRKNWSRYQPLLDQSHVKYIRSGNQLRRDGYFYAALYLFYKYTGSFAAFSLYNRRNIISLDSRNLTILPSITCNRDNSIEQIIRFIRQMPNNSAAILMLHSVLEQSDSGFGEDKWSNTTEEFHQLCAFLEQEESLQVITTEKLCNLLK